MSESKIFSADGGDEAALVLYDPSQNEKEQILKEPKVDMLFDSYENAYAYYKEFAKHQGFSIVKRTVKNRMDGKIRYACLACSRSRKSVVKTKNLLKPRPQTKIGCPTHVNVGLNEDGKWRMSQVILDHNHDQSQEKTKHLKAYRVIDEHTKRRIELNDETVINLNKTVDSMWIASGCPDSLPFTQRDCRNYLDSYRRSLLVEGDAEAMYKYFMRMHSDNSNFFYALDLDDNGRLRNVFWADAMSRAAATEFGDVVTFDTTYLANRYDIPFAVGVNHYGQSILLGCELISHEDIESFKWLFQTWKICMWNCPPNAIITDQSMAMKNAIENVLPSTQHRWCIWHIMKKIPEKFGAHKDIHQISGSLRRIVYNSLTSFQFEDSWSDFIKEYNLDSNFWLNGLYE